MKKNRISWGTMLPEGGVKFTEPEIMVKLIGTVDDHDYPHITLLICTKAVSPKVIKWGQFTQGRSKRNILKNPRQCAFFMSASIPYKFIQVKMDLDRVSVEGDDAADLNAQDLLRYNTYIRIEKVYFNKIHSCSPIRPLSLLGIIKGIIVNAFGIGGLHSDKKDERLPLFGKKLFKDPISPKFIGYVDIDDGYPVILPCLQARQVDRNVIAFPYTQFKPELEKLKKGQKLAFFGLSMELTSILVKGTLIDWKKSRGVRYAFVNIEEVYNSMPPVAGVIYPELETRPKVTIF